MCSVSGKGASMLTDDQEVGGGKGGDFMGRGLSEEEEEELKKLAGLLSLLLVPVSRRVLIGRRTSFLFHSCFQ